MTRLMRLGLGTNALAIIMTGLCTEVIKWERHNFLMFIPIAFDLETIGIS